MIDLGVLGRISDTALTRDSAIRFAAKRLAEHLRPRTQPAVLHLRGGVGLSARHQAPGRRHVRDRLFGISRLPRRHAEGIAGDAVARHGSSLCDPYAADVARQGGDLGARAGPRRRDAGRADPRGDAQLLQRRPRAPPRLGLWLRRLPGLRPAPPGVGSIRSETHDLRRQGNLLHIAGRGGVDRAACRVLPVFRLQSVVRARGGPGRARSARSATPTLSAWTAPRAADTATPARSPTGSRRCGRTERRPALSSAPAASRCCSSIRR